MTTARLPVPRVSVFEHIIEVLPEAGGFLSHVKEAALGGALAVSATALYLFARLRLWPRGKGGRGSARRRSAKRGRIESRERRGGGGNRK